METIPQLTVTNEKIRLLSVQTDMFKTSVLTLNVLMPIGQNSAEHTVLSSYLAHSTNVYKTLAKLNARLEELYGAALSGSIAKLGEAYRIQLSVTCIDDALALDNNSVFADSLELLLQTFLNPLADENGFCAKQLTTEIRLTVEDIESEINDKRAYALTKMLETMCADEPYGLTKAELLEAVKRVTPESMLEAWRRMLSDAQIQLNMIGNMDRALCEKKVSAAFAQIKDRMPLAAETVFVEEAQDVTEVTEQMDMNQSKLVLGFRTGMKNENDDFYARRIMTDVFGGGPYSRLFMNVREKLSLCYYCSARLLRNKGIMLVQSGIEKDNKQKVLDEIYRQLDVMKKGAFSDEDLEASKKGVCDAYLSFGDTPDGLDMYYGMQMTGDIVSPEEAVRHFRAVTREDVIRAANELTLDMVYMLAGN